METCTHFFMNLDYFLWLYFLIFKDKKNKTISFLANYSLLIFFFSINSNTFKTVYTDPISFKIAHKKLWPGRQRCCRVPVPIKVVFSKLASIHYEHTNYSRDHEWFFLLRTIRKYKGTKPNGLINSMYLMNTKNIMWRHKQIFSKYKKHKNYLLDSLKQYFKSAVVPITIENVRGTVAEWPNRFRTYMKAALR